MNMTRTLGLFLLSLTFLTALAPSISAAEARPDADVLTNTLIVGGGPSCRGLQGLANCAAHEGGCIAAYILTRTEPPACKADAASTHTLA